MLMIMNDTGMTKDTIKFKSNTTKWKVAFNRYIVKESRMEQQNREDFNESTKYEKKT